MTRRVLIAFLLALALPFAQMAATAHELSHVRAQLGKSAPAGAHCDLCAVAAAVTGGAAASVPLTFALAPAQAIEPAWELPATPAVERITLFLSRAPPFLR